MVARELISPDIPALQVTQTGRDAFYLLGEHHVKHLPVVSDGKLLGVISEEDIFNHKIYEPLKEYDFSQIRQFSVRGKDHLFEIIRIMADNRLTVIPVVEEDDRYLGLISQENLIQAFARTSSFAEPGAVVLLEMHRRDYSLATIARIVEEEEMKILGAYLSSTQDSEMVELTIKISNPDLGRIISSLERHGYVVREAISESENEQYYNDRYESLMNYLNL